MSSDFFEELKSRGLVHQTTDESALIKQLNEDSVKLYIGFDPTADSLHIGQIGRASCRERVSSSV